MSWWHVKYKQARMKKPRMLTAWVSLSLSQSLNLYNYEDATPFPWHAHVWRGLDEERLWTFCVPVEFKGCVCHLPMWEILQTLRFKWTSYEHVLNIYVLRIRFVTWNVFFCWNAWSSSSEKGRLRCKYYCYQDDSANSDVSYIQQTTLPLVIAMTMIKECPI